MNKETLEKERKHLKDTLVILEKAKLALEEGITNLGEETLDKLYELRQDTETNSMDFFMYLEKLHEKHAAYNLKDRFQRLEELDSSLKEPYFARLDLEEPETKDEQTIYIGKFGYTPNHKPLITDWRSKIASVYYRYRYPQKNVEYTTKEGKKVRNLTLKRTFDISAGELVKYYNNDIQLDETQIIAEKIEGRTGGVLEDIVETIQASQLDIIEEDPRNPCIVQGCVGSGKSTVAIHKLSHIFFNYPNLIDPQRSILIAKKQILVSYLATLFPKLGIFDINYKTLSDLVYNFAFREELGIKPDFSLPENKDLLSLGSLKHLTQLIEQVAVEAEEKLAQIFSGDNESFGGYTYDKDLSPFENFTQVEKDLREELQNQVETLKENPNSSRAWLYRLNIDSLREILKDLGKFRSRLKDKFFSAILKEINIDPKEKMGYAQTLAFVYLHSNIMGFNKFQKFQYCVIDEGQDFSPLEYAVLDTFVLFKRFCILGDLNQGYMKSGLKNWEVLKQFFSNTEIKEFSLDTNYRSTKQIIDYANQILAPFTKTYLPKSINRMGPNPTTKTFSKTEELYEILASDLFEDIKEIKKTIGIICYDQKSFEEMRNLLNKLPLADDKKIVLDADRKIDYKPKCIYLTEFENSKGLEFAKVYIVGTNPRQNADFSHAKKSFVGVTRAMDELMIYYVEENAKSN